MEDWFADLLLFVATETEQAELLREAEELEVPFLRAEHPLLGECHRRAAIGDYRVVAVRTRMGALRHRGAAFAAIHWQFATGATGIVQLGMAFGANPDQQRYGDVLVSTSIFPYDYRVVRSAEGGYVVDYSETKPIRSSPELIDLFAKCKSRHPFDAHFGMLLSGGARIHSLRFRDELLRDTAAAGELAIGGEMEGVGIMAAAPAATPTGIVVKGIADFADEQRDAIIDATRPVACRNAARFVLQALLADRQGRETEQAPDGP